MGTRLWAALLVCLGSAAGAQAVPITLGLSVTVSELIDWENNPYAPPNQLAVGDTGTVLYGFDSDDLVVETPGCAACLGDVTLSVAPWSFQASFPDAGFAGFGGGNPWGVLHISLFDGAVDMVRIDAGEDDASFHTLILYDDSGTFFSAAAPPSSAALAQLLAPDRFSQWSWKLATQPGGTAVAGNPIPEPGAGALFALALLVLQRSRLLRA